MSVLEAGGFVQLVGGCSKWGWGDPQPLFLFVALNRGSWKADDADQLCLLLAVWHGEGARHGEFLANK